jgi:hypothetical protein
MASQELDMKRWQPAPRQSRAGSFIHHPKVQARHRVIFDRSNTMKFSLPLSSIVAAAATVIFAASAPVHAAQQPLKFLGNVAQASSAERVIVITDATRYINVEGGETVRFVIGDQSFTWNFSIGPGHVAPFDLSRIAPAGVLNHPVMTYVSNDPLYAA